MRKSNPEIAASCIFDVFTVKIFDSSYFKILIRIGVIVDAEGLEI